MSGLTLQGLGKGTQVGYYAAFGLGLDGSQLNIPKELRTLSYVVIVNSSLSEIVVV